MVIHLARDHLYTCQHISPLGTNYLTRNLNDEQGATLRNQALRSRLKLGSTRYNTAYTSSADSLSF
jgi:hypothetical protein